MTLTLRPDGNRTPNWGPLLISPVATGEESLHALVPLLLDGRSRGELLVLNGAVGSGLLALDNSMGPHPVSPGWDNLPELPPGTGPSPTSMRGPFSMASLPGDNSPWFDNVSAPDQSVIHFVAFASNDNPPQRPVRLLLGCGSFCNPHNQIPIEWIADGCTASGF